MESREAKRTQAQTSPERIGPGEFATRTAITRRHSDDLHVCQTCASQLVYPTDWVPVPSSERRWSVQLRCPDCEWTGGGTYDQDVVDRFDEALDRGTEAVLADLQAIARANMEEEVENFIRALELELILPEDF
jgi:hypothetical protein